MISRHQEEEFFLISNHISTSGNLSPYQPAGGAQKGHPWLNWEGSLTDPQVSTLCCPVLWLPDSRCSPVVLYRCRRRRHHCSLFCFASATSAPLEKCLNPKRPSIVYILGTGGPQVAETPPKGITEQTSHSNKTQSAPPTLVAV